MLRALVLAAMLATAYCGAKGSPQPPVRDAGDAGPAASPSPAPDAGGEPPTGDKGPP